MTTAVKGGGDRRRYQRSFAAVPSQKWGTLPQNCVGGTHLISEVIR